MPFPPSYFDQYRRTNKPSPFKWPARLSAEITKYPELVDPELFSQAKSYQSHIQRLKAEGIQSSTQASKILHRKGYRLFGWSKKLVSNVLGADPNLGMPSVPERLGPGFIKEWNKQALTQRLATGVRQGPFDPIPLPEFYQGIAGRAQRFGIGKQLLSELSPEAPKQLAETLFPPTLTQRVTGAGKSFLGAAKALPTRYKIGIGAGAALLGLYAMQPGSWFSGKDDRYNTIEGLGHKGIAWQSRKELTDFGSGWRGLSSHLSRNAQSYSLGAVGAGSLSRYIYQNRQKDYKKTSENNIEYYSVPDSLQKKLINLNAGVATYQGLRKMLIATAKTKQERSDTMSFLKSTPKDEPFIFVNELSLKLTKNTNLEKTLRHESLHIGIRKAGIKEEVKKLNELTPQKFKDYHDRTYKKSKIANLNKSTVFEEYLAHQVATPKNKRDTLASNLFSGFDDAYNTIEGLQHGGFAEKLRRVLTDFGSGYQGDKSYEREVKERFSFFTQALEKYGKKTGTGHKRVYVPKTALSREQIEDVLGFTPVKIAIPEAGQTSDISYRHAENLFHLHEFENFWTMHEDEHAAFTMALKKREMEGSFSLTTFFSDAVKGASHIVGEGIPGAFYYLRGQITGVRPMITRLRESLSEKYKGLVSQLERIKEPGIIFSSLDKVQSAVRKGFDKISERTFSGFNSAYNTIEGLRHGGMAEQKREELTDFGSRSVVSKLLTRVQRTMGQASRSLNVFNWVNKSSNRIISNVTKEIVSGAKAGKPLELLTSGVTIAEGAHVAAEIMSIGAITPGIAAGAAAGFVGTKYAYEIIKNRRLFQKTFFWAKKNPSEAKLGVMEFFKAGREELSNYVIKGRSTLASSYIKAGGGEYGRQIFLGNLETKYGVSLAGLESKILKTDIENAIRTSSLEGISNKLNLNQLLLSNPKLISKLSSNKGFSAFSGFDDAYNTIEGLKHGGIAEQMRRELTDFGSGYRGILKLPSILESVFKEAGVGAQAIGREQLPGFIRQTISSSLKRGGAASKFTAGEKALVNTEIGKFLKSAESSAYEDVIVLNIGAMKESAKAAGSSWGGYLKGTIKHERFHQALTQSGKRKEFMKSVKVASGFKKQIKAQYKSHGIKLDEETMKEEFLAHSITAEYLGQKMKTWSSQDAFKLGREQVSKIESELNQKFLKGNNRGIGLRGREALHRGAQMDLTKNTSIGGKGHRNMNTAGRRM